MDKQIRKPNVNRKFPKFITKKNYVLEWHYINQRKVSNFKLSTGAKENTHMTPTL